MGQGLEYFHGRQYLYKPMELGWIKKSLSEYDNNELLIATESPASAKTTSIGLFTRFLHTREARKFVQAQKNRLGE